MGENNMIYLAVPYSHPDPRVRLGRFVAVNRVAASLMRQGFLVFSPISHGHPICAEGDLPGDWQYWEHFCRAILKICKRFVVLQLDGWENSVGVQNELRLARELGIPIEYWRPDNAMQALPKRPSIAISNQGTY